jgi:hypothetical protein
LTQKQATPVEAIPSDTLGRRDLAMMSVFF